MYKFEKFPFQKESKGILFKRNFPLYNLFCERENVQICILGQSVYFILSYPYKLKFLEYSVKTFYYSEQLQCIYWIKEDNEDNKIIQEINYYPDWVYKSSSDIKKEVENYRYYFKLV